jgi:uncharacterized protein YbaP (TraB family)
MVRKWLGRVFGAVATLGLTGAAPVAAVPTGKPALWKLADKDTTIYLFGTIHILPDGQQWRTPAFEKALASADELVLEVANLEDPAVAGEVLALGRSPGLKPLAERVAPEKRAALEKAVAASGIPASYMDGMETWAAGLVLLQVSFQKMGLDPSQGAERKVTESWKAHGARPVRGFETAKEQFGFLDTLSEGSQRAFLESVLEDPEASKKQFAAMVKSWMAGDLKGIEATFDSETEMSPELREVLMKRRNAKWADWLATRMKSPGTVFVAVGAGHLAGHDSVREMLKARGFKAKRVQ